LAKVTSSMLGDLGCSGLIRCMDMVFVPRDDATRGPRRLVGMCTKSFVGYPMERQATSMVSCGVFGVPSPGWTQTRKRRGTWRGCDTSDVGRYDHHLKATGGHSAFLFRKFNPGYWPKQLVSVLSIPSSLPNTYTGSVHDIRMPGIIILQCSHVDHWCLPVPCASLAKSRSRSAPQVAVGPYPSL
jgi:hypothetical protein